MMVLKYLPPIHIPLNTKITGVAMRTLISFVRYTGGMRTSQSGKHVFLLTKCGAEGKSKLIHDYSTHTTQNIKER